MATTADLEEVALGLPNTATATAPSTGHRQMRTNGRCFVEVDATDADRVRVWHDGAWVEMGLASATTDELRAAVAKAWRQRAHRWDVWALDSAIGADEVAAVVAALRSWPELVEKGAGNFYAGGRAFLHFHPTADGPYADVKEGLGWGAPLTLPLGRPAEDAVAPVLTEVRRRLGVTLEAIEDRKRKPRR